jgi:predicted lipoprotein with Yx(FWY)xxD motif
MRPNHRWTSIAGLVVGAAIVAGACSSAATTPTAAVASATAMATAADTSGSSAGAGAAAAITLASVTNPTLGAYLTGAGGMTLYVLTKDTADTSTCTGSCATNWPPLTVASGAAVTGPAGALEFATIARADGTVQVTYNHMPLYYFAGDSKAGDITGQGKSGVWFVAPLSGTLASPAAATPAATTATPVVTSGY